MRRGTLRLFVGAALLAVVPGAAAEDGTVYAFRARRLDGPEQGLDDYRGRVLLLVNTASRCGFTPQYEGLEALYQRHRERGFAVLGFPSNDFGEQEPGSDAEIARFCKANYGVEFPMFSKIAVTGDAAHPLYRWLAALPDPVGGPVRWNFQKYLVDRRGRVVARYDSRVSPDDPALLSRLEALLAAGP
jgi:glutathione peroxidase